MVMCNVAPYLVHIDGMGRTEVRIDDYRAVLSLVEVDRMVVLAGLNDTREDMQAAKDAAFTCQHPRVRRRMRSGNVKTTRRRTRCWRIAHRASRPLRRVTGACRSVPKRANQVC